MRAGAPMPIGRATALAALAVSIVQVLMVLLISQSTTSLARFDRGVALLVAPWLASVLAAGLIRRFVPHVAGAMAMGFFATIGFLCGAAAALSWLPVNGLVLLVPAGLGSFIGAFVNGRWFPIAAPESAGARIEGVRND